MVDPVHGSERRAPPVLPGMLHLTRVSQAQHEMKVFPPAPPLHLERHAASLNLTTFCI